MAEATERLLLQVDASIELLRRELASADQPMTQLERRAAGMSRNVDKSIGEMGSRFGEFARLADDSAKRAERSFEASFAQVRAVAGQAIKGPTIDGKVDLGIEELRRQSAAAAQQADAYRLIGAAMERAAKSADDRTEATRLAIQATAAQRIEAERAAASLAQEAGALERVQIELMQSTQAVDLFVTSHQRMALAAQESRDAADAAARLAGAEKLLAAEAIEVRSAIDPMYAAQLRFDGEMERADRLLAAGVLGQREYQQAVTVARDRLQQHAAQVAGNVSQEVVHARQLGRTQAAMQGISYQAQDTFTQLSMGANVFNVLAVQGMQATGQMTMLEGRMGKFAAFMQGPYGLAITGAILVVGALTKDLDLFGDELDDAVEKMRKDAEQTATTDRAKQIYGSTLEGLTEAIRTNKKAIEDLSDASKTAARRALEESLAILTKTEATRADTAAQVENARAYLSAQQSRAKGSGEGADLAALDLPRRQQELTELEQRLAATDSALAEAKRQVEEALSARVVERAGRSEEDRIRERYDRQIEAVRKRAVAEKTVSTELSRQVELLKKQRDEEIKAAQERARPAGTANRQFGREIDLAGARAIVAGIGGRVTSGLRSTAEQARIYADQQAGRHVGPVAKPGTSAHERGQALDVAYGPGISVASIRKAFEDAGVRLKKILDEPSQRVFHVEWGKAGKAGPSAETLRKREVAAERREMRDENAYGREILAARRRLMDASARTASSAEREALQREEIEAEAQTEQAAIGRRLKAGDLSAAEALRLSTLIESIRKEKLRGIEVDRATRLIERQYDTIAEDGASRLDVLRIQQDTAITERERRRIARQILDLEQQMRRQALERVRDTSQDPEAVLAAKRQLDRLPAMEDAEDRQFDQRAASPFEAYRDRLKAATSDTNAQLQSIAIDGWQRLEDAGSRAAAQAVTDLLGIEGVAADVIGSVIADLARLAAQKAVVAAIGGGIFGFADGGPLSGLPGFADGGSPGGLIRGPGTARSDSILALLSNGRGAIRVSNQEFIVNGKATKEWLPELAAINSGRVRKFAGGGLVAPSMPRLREPSPNMARLARGRTDRLQLDVRSRVEGSDLLKVTMEETAVRTVGAAAEPIMAGAETRTLKRMGRQSLPGGWGWG